MKALKATILLSVFTSGCVFTFDQTLTPATDAVTESFTPQVQKKSDLEHPHQPVAATSRIEKSQLSQTEEFYAWAASQGYPRAQYLYAMYLFENQRPLEAETWLNRSAEKGESLAILRLAQLSAEKSPNDLQRAQMLLLPLIQKHDLDALMLGADFAIKLQQFDQAVSYLTQAANLGHPSAQQRLLSLLAQQDEKKYQEVQTQWNTLEDDSLIPEYIDLFQRWPDHDHEKIVTGLENHSQESVEDLFRKSIVLKDFFPLIDEAAQRGSSYAALAEARARIDLPSFTPASKISLKSLLDTAAVLVPGQILKARMIFQKKVPGSFQDAWACLEQAAQAHDPYALFALSARSRALHDYDRAVEYYQQGLNQKDFSDALAQWAIDMLHGYFPFYQDESAYDALFYLATAYHPQALLALADAKEKNHIPGKPEEIFQFRYQAAWQGLPQAQYLVANAYLIGQGVPADSHKAFRWFLQSARAGYRPAQYQVSELYAQGEGVYPSLPKAYAWRTLALKSLYEDPIKHGQQFVEQMTWDQLYQAQVLAHAYEKQYYSPGAW